MRTEQSYSGGAWNNDNKLTYKYDALERLGYEERHDWAAGAWSTRYDTTQSYDKNGNRTGYDHNVATGYTTSYGRACNLSYTFDAVNALTAVTDADDARYGAALTCDANGNITTVLEYNYSAGTPPIPESTLQTDFSYDDLNRLTRHQTTRYVGGGTANTQYVRRDHEYDATGRLVKSSYLTWYEGDTPPTPSTLEHVYDGARHVQNYDGTSAYGAVWHWAGAANSHGAPLKSPNPDTASQKGYNIAALGGKGDPQRRTWLDALTEGDKREIYGQGRPMAKDSSGSGANWYIGTVSDPPVSGSSVESRFFFEGTVCGGAGGWSTSTLSRATDAREAGRIGIFGTSNSYGGAYGRVTNEALGRDLNPLGRGSGYALVAGVLNVGSILPILPKYVYSGGNQGSSVNNPGCCGGGGLAGISSGYGKLPTIDKKPGTPSSESTLLRNCGGTALHNPACQVSWRGPALYTNYSNRAETNLCTNPLNQSCFFYDPKGVICDLGSSPLCLGESCRTHMASEKLPLVANSPVATEQLPEVGPIKLTCTRFLHLCLGSMSTEHDYSCDCSQEKLSHSYKDDWKAAVGKGYSLAEIYGVNVLEKSPCHLLIHSTVVAQFAITDSSSPPPGFCEPHWNYGSLGQGNGGRNPDVTDYGGFHTGRALCCDKNCKLALSMTMFQDKGGSPLVCMWDQAAAYMSRDHRRPGKGGPAFPGEPGFLPVQFTDESVSRFSCCKKLLAARQRVAADNSPFYGATGHVIDINCG